MVKMEIDLNNGLAKGQNIDIRLEKCIGFEWCKPKEEIEDYFHH